MLVYSNSFYLDGAQGFQPVLQQLANWMTFKKRESVSLAQLSKKNSLRLGSGNQLETNMLNFREGAAALYAVRYSHKDSQVHGRLWKLEIGLSQDASGAPVFCSVLLQTNEISSRVSTNIQASCPAVVSMILETCQPVPETPGLSIKALTVESARAFKNVIEEPRRHYPLIVISPLTSDGYCVNINRLFRSVRGLAEIIQIPEGEDTYLIQSIVGRPYTPYGGAVNVIFPRWGSRPDAPIQAYRLLANDLEAMEIPESELLSIITHRTNLPHSWRHLSLERVGQASLRCELTERKEAADKTGNINDYKDYIDLLEVEVEQIVTAQKELELQKQNLENELAGAQAENEVQKRLFEYEKQGLISALKGQGTPAREMNWLSRDRQDLFLEIIGPSLSLPQSLDVIGGLFDERLVILDSARSSADASSVFKDRKKAFHLLWHLATDYWQALISNGGDNEARKVFGAAYAAKESETVENNKRARALRTFTYQDKPVEMMKHLKIGVKESLAETLRIHFHWDATAQKIVIGHCGKHLDHK